MPPEPAPAPPAPVPDLIGVALGSFAAGATTGAVVVTLGLLVFRTHLGPILPVLLFAGVVAAATTGWTLARPITDWWRRGVTTALAVFGAMLLGAVSAPADMIAGRAGLAGLATALLVAATGATRYALRSRTRER